ncbi:MAG: ABC transporter permease [Actinomycetota bacterium]|nr:ABC transporter permease [Actinomycetota bacterium]
MDAPVHTPGTAAAVHHRRTPGALRVLSWHLAAYRRLWKVNVLASFGQPLLYLLGLGVGVGALVDKNTGSSEVLGSSSYVAFVVPGLLVTTAMALAAGESMWPVMGGLKWHRGYHGIAATPLEARDIVLGHGAWMAVRCGLATGAVAVVLAVFPDTRSWGLAPSVLVSMLVGVSFAMPIMAFSVGSEYDGAFAGIQRFVIIPLFLFGGAFYPLSQLPAAVQWVAKVAPLWHGVVVARGFTSGNVDWTGVAGHLSFVALWAVAGTAITIRRLRGKLYP